MCDSSVAVALTHILKYPVDAGCYAPIGEDQNLCDQGLTEESLILFQIAGGGSTVLKLSRHNDSEELGVQYSFVPSDEIEANGISQYILDPSWYHLVFIIQPAFSWSQLSVTEAAFRAILSGLRVFTPFIHVVQAFGTKTSDKDRVNDLVYCYTGLSFCYEICYNIRYFELNGRSKGNPWSLRQTGVYQRSLATKQSTWLLLNYSDYMNQRVKAAFEEQKKLSPGPCAATQLLPHLFILFAATRSWRSYIETLRRRLAHYETKAYSSRINETYLDDYKICFQDVQETTMIHDTVAVATSVIAKQSEVLTKCNHLHFRLHGKQSSVSQCDMASTLAMLKSNIQHQHEKLVALGRAASQIIQLLSSMLDARTTGNLRESITVIEKATGAIQRQTTRTGLDTDHLRRVVTGAQKDARTVKLLAQIATLFLPASLIASLFSSTIFSDSGSNTSYIGLYFAITLPLLFITLILLILLEKNVFLSFWR